LAKKHSKKKKHEDAPEGAAKGAAVDVEADAADVAALEEKIAALEKELEEVRDEAREAGDRALRTLAEFDNYRRRSRRENEEATGAGAAKVLGEALQLADDLGRALDHAGDDVPAHFLEGIQLVARGVGDLLDRHGVERVAAVGEVFDPRVHEAISIIPATDGQAPNTAAHEVQPGYVQGERVLRPAKVVVTRAEDPGAEAGAGDAAAGDATEESDDAA